MPDHEELEMILESMIRTLDDHNYKKVTYCRDCYFWGSRSYDETKSKNIRLCRRYDTDTYHDDWCSEAVGKRKEEQRKEE